MRSAARPALRIVVLKGNGRHFQAGADLDWISGVAAQSPSENERGQPRDRRGGRPARTCPVPTLALVQGGCFGGGTGIAAACDVVVAAEDAIFSISEVRWGLMAAIILPQLCRGDLGLRQVRRYALTGERFGAAEARRLGLVHEVVPLDGSRPPARRWWRSCSRTARKRWPRPRPLPLTVPGAGSTRDPRRPGREPRPQAALAEAAEGLASFAEKRAASWPR